MRINRRIIRASVRASLAAGLVTLFAVAVQLSKADPIKVFVDGDRVKFEDVGPQAVSGRILVPVRGVLEKMGAQVDWAPENQRVNASDGEIDIVLHIGDRTARVNGHEVQMDVPAQTIGGHTMVPLRFLSECLGAKVRWDASESTVFIMTAPSGRNSDDHPRLPRRNPDDKKRDDGTPRGDRKRDP